MKKYILSLFVLAAFASCEEFTNSAEKSGVTYFPKITMNGEPEVELACDATGFVDEGVTMMEGETEIEVETVVTGNYFGGAIGADNTWEYTESATVPDGPDFYDITYSGVNKDGIPGVATRHVFRPACNDDLTEGIAGYYLADVVRTLTSTGAPAPGATGPYYDTPFLIKDLGNGNYQLSDMLGGWYTYGRAFGYTGAAPGAIIHVNNLATDDFTHTTVVRDVTFGDLTEITEFKVNEGAGTITFTALWDAGYTFKVTLTPVE
jgi:hypothetical protein